MSVFVSGASGFIALHVIDVLLSKNYTVIGSVRSTEKGDNLVKNFKAKYPNAKLSYEIVKDIGDAGSFDEAMKKHADELEFVLHTASPFSFGLEKGADEAYLRPALQGTTNILKAIKAYAPKVKKVVITSSFAAILHSGADPKTFTHTELTWNPMDWETARKNEVTAYTVSKKYAEKAGWDFLKDEKPNFTLTTVNPPYVFGPQMFPEVLSNPTLNTSAEITNSMLKTTPADDGKPFDTPALAVDVRDVALLHVLPLENDKLANERLFPVNAGFCFQRILNILNDKFPELRGKISKGDPSCVEKAEANCPSYDISKTLKLTGITLIPFEKTIYDSAKQILDYQASH